MSTPVSFDWVLSQLAGMSFPEPGGAYEYMKGCFEAQKADYEVQLALDKLTCKQAAALYNMWSVIAREENNEAKAITLLREADIIVCFGDAPVPKGLHVYANFEAGLKTYRKRYGGLNLP